MKKVVVFGVVLAVALALAAVALAADKADTKPVAKGLDKKAAVGAKVADPVNGKEVTVADKTPMSEYMKKFYYFENDANKKAFDAEPTKYNK